jgi:hypothetical protein
MSAIINDKTIDGVSTRVLTLKTGAFVRHLDFPVAGPYSVTLRESSGNSRTITIGAHSILAGDYMTVSGMDDSDYDSYHISGTARHYVLVTSVTGTTVTYFHNTSKTEGSTAETSGKCMVTQWRILRLSLRLACDDGANIGVDDQGYMLFMGLSADDSDPYGNCKHIMGARMYTSGYLRWNGPTYSYRIDSGLLRWQFKTSGLTGSTWYTPDLSFGIPATRSAPAIMGDYARPRTLMMKFTKTTTSESSLDLSSGDVRAWDDSVDDSNADYQDVANKFVDGWNDRYDGDQSTNYENTWENAQLGPLNRFVFAWPYESPLEICEFGFSVFNDFQPYAA